jgi:uncharacterized RDD family membrane protein YckC
MEDYSQPAGFWIRVGASIIDFLVFIPIMLLSWWNLTTFKSTLALVLMSVPGLIYKPFMEAFFGATLGKMACGIRVIDDDGKKLSLLSAYIRFLPFLMASAISLASQVIMFSSPEFQAGAPPTEPGQMPQFSLLDIIGLGLNLLVVIDCVVVAFTFRKRALHDMLAESFCVYKAPQRPSSEPSEAEG